jgi:hypothetical protein
MPFHTLGRALKGEHTEEALRTLAGYTRAEIQQLRE